MTEEEGAAPLHKPPLPPTVPFNGRGNSEHNFMKSSGDSVSIGGTSTDSREVLRKELQKRRHSLTPQEHGFLEHLIVNGDEIEVAMARETLCDEELFFDSDKWGSGISLGGSDNEISEPIMKALGKEKAGEDTRRTADKLGSEKRHEHLFRRRESKLYANLWKSHEHGFSVKRPTRQRSASIANIYEAQKMARKNSFLSVEIEDLLKNGGPQVREGEDEVFRRTEQDKVFRNDPFVNGQKASSGRGVLWNPGPKNAVRRQHSRSVSFAEHKPQEEGEDRHTPLLTGIPPRVSLQDRRGSTDTQVSELGTDLDDFLALRRSPPVRSDSIPSIPSLHHAHHIRSDSVVSENFPHSGSISSIPSLHHGHPIRSDSGIRSDSVISESSGPPVQHGDPLHDRFASTALRLSSSLHEHSIKGRFASSPFELLMSERSLASIPSLHHGHAIRSDSVVSTSSIPSLHHPNPIRSDSVVSLHSTTFPTNDKIHQPAWTAPLTKTDEEPKKQQLHRHPSQAPQRPVLMRRASVNNYNGEGIEVTELDDSDGPEVDIDRVDKARKYRSMLSELTASNGTNVPSSDRPEVEIDRVDKANKYRSMLSELTASNGTSVPSSSSFDESMRRRSIFREIERSLSDEDRSSFFLGSSRDLLNESRRSVNSLRSDENSSWDMEEDSLKEHFDAWDALDEDPAAGYGGGLPFVILGTSANDETATPHVLSPPLMESLQYFFPYSLTESNFWMKFSLLRDGDSMHSLLQKVRGATHTIIAIETVDGEVFGSFQSAPWRKQWKYFGSGESFLWKMRKSRQTPCHSIIDQAQMESELDVYPWSGENDCVQLCTSDRFAVGGGDVKDEKKAAEDSESPAYGFGLSLEKDLLYGTSSHCATFSSPPLSIHHSDGSPFEIVNLEVWALTPCMTLEAAEKLELGQLFLRKN